MALQVRTYKLETVEAHIPQRTYTGICEGSNDLANEAESNRIALDKMTTTVCEFAKTVLSTKQEYEGKFVNSGITSYLTTKPAPAQTDVEAVSRTTNQCLTTFVEIFSMLRDSRLAKHSVVQHIRDHQANLPDKDSQEYVKLEKSMPGIGEYARQNAQNTLSAWQEMNESYDRLYNSDNELKKALGSTGEHLRALDSYAHKDRVLVHTMYGNTPLSLHDEKLLTEILAAKNDELLKGEIEGKPKLDHAIAICKAMLYKQPDTERAADIRMALGWLLMLKAFSADSEQLRYIDLIQVRSYLQAMKVFIEKKEDNDGASCPFPKEFTLVMCLAKLDAVENMISEKFTLPATIRHCKLDKLGETLSHLNAVQLAQHQKEIKDKKIEFQRRFMLNLVSQFDLGIWPEDEKEQKLIVTYWSTLLKESHKRYSERPEKMAALFDRGIYTESEGAHLAILDFWRTVDEGHPRFKEKRDVLLQLSKEHGLYPQNKADLNILMEIWGEKLEKDSTDAEARAEIKKIDALASKL